MNETKENRAKDQAKAQYESIREMVEAMEMANAGELRHADWKTEDDVREAIQEDPLEVSVRGGWCSPGSEEAAVPCEYKILLCTGGPAVRITGRLGMHNEPVDATLEHQDWFTPWVKYDDEDVDENILLAYAREFYFGE